MKKIKPSFSLKDQLFNKQKVVYISTLIKKTYPDFLSKDFEREVLGKFVELELKQRISHISDMLKKYLTDDFEESVNILISSLPEMGDNGTLDNNFGDFIFTPYCDYIRKFGCNEKYLSFSLFAQGEFTSYASAEDSIRYFFNKFEKETFDKMFEWSKSDNYFLRRLASEGSRAKLPWYHKIKLDYKSTIKILDNLYYDNSRFVTRSVANHLNDISKIDANLVINTLEKWQKQDKIKNVSSNINSKNDLEYIISHSTRTLIKAGNKKTLEFLGYSTSTEIDIINFYVKNTTIKIGESLEFEFEVKSKKTENLIIDYRIYFIGKNNKLLPKVFKIKKVKISKKLNIIKKHPFKIMSTRGLYEGEHFVEIIVNGNNFGKQSFILTK